jgi:tRNA-splicing endonuclease subunit Sen54
MGHFVSRTEPNELEGLEKVHKRMELLPEEALYLIERGSLFCWSPFQYIPTDLPGLDDMEGAPMSVQQAFAEMVGAEGLSLEKYQVGL